MHIVYVRMCDIRRCLTARVSDVLRRAIQDSGLSLSEIARAVDIDPGRISRFTRRERSLTLPAADRLAKYFKLQLTRLGGKRHE